MTRIPIALLLLPVLLVPAVAGAVQSGLEAIEIAPAQTPEKPGDLAKRLKKHPGFVSADWDAERGLFIVAVEDGLPLSTPELRNEIAALGLAPAEMELSFKSVKAEVENRSGFLVSAANGFKLPVKWTTHSRRFWGFRGQNPRGEHADFRVRCRVIPGAIDETGAAAPDTVDILHFELTEPAYVEKPK